jgi:hypothetical protein
LSWLSESLQLYEILHPSAATSPSGTGISQEETNLASMGGGSMLRLVFDSETVEFLLPNVPGHCRAGGKNHEFGTGRHELVECAKFGSLTHLYNILH